MARWASPPLSKRLRMHSTATPPVTLKLVDWADEEGARFGRSLLGSSAAAGSLSIDAVRDLKDRQGVTLLDALAENGVTLERMVEARNELEAIDARAYLELHIEQGPVLESMQKSTGAVLGTFGVERHMLRFTGQAAHSGSTPIPMRRDAFLAAAETALECRRLALRHSKPGAGRGVHRRHRQRRAEDRDGRAGRVRDLARSACARPVGPGGDARAKRVRFPSGSRARTTSPWSGSRSGASSPDCSTRRSCGCAKTPSARRRATRRSCRPARSTTRPRWCRTCRS